MVALPFIPALGRQGQTAMSSKPACSTGQVPGQPGLQCLKCIVGGTQDQRKQQKKFSFKDGDESTSHANKPKGTRQLYIFRARTIIVR